MEIDDICSKLTQPAAEYRPGEIAFVDYGGGIIEITPETGKPFAAQLFVGVHFASGLVFVHATRSQRTSDRLESHQRMFCHWGGTPKAIIPGNLKSDVQKASYRGEPEIAFDYLELANHYNVNIVPAHLYHPRDKAKAETAILVATRWVIFALRHETFRSLFDLNRSIAQCVERINNKPMRGTGKTRTQLFEDKEQTFLQPLPAMAWEIAVEDYRQVNLDYHVEFERHAYSVPSLLIGHKVLIRVTVETVDIYYNLEHVASHARAYEPGRTTNPLHPLYLNWSANDALQAASSLGPSCGILLEQIFAADKHIDHQRRAHQSLQNMAKEYGQSRLESACARAVGASTFQMTFVRNLLRNQREAHTPTGND